MYFRSVTDKVAETLRNKIVQGKLKPGQRIIDSNIMSELNVSRTPIREAFKTLNAEGLVSIIPRKGVFVSELRLKDAKEIYDIMAALFVLAVDLAMDRISDSDIKKLRNIYEKMGGCVKPGIINDINRYMHFHLKFHDTLFEISENNRLRLIWNNMFNQIRRFSHQSISHPKHLLRSCHRHKEILDAIEAGDKALAKEITYTHVMEGFENFNDIFKTIQKK